MVKQTKSRSAPKRQPAKVKSKTTQKTKPALFSSNKSRWWLLAPLAVLLLVGIIGVGATYFSKATTALSSEQCYLRGRSYSSGDCKKSCLSGAGSLKYGKAYDWCSNAISVTVSSSTCSSKGRKYVSGTGCSRRWQQTNLKGAKQCVKSTATYIVSSVDYCKSAGGDSPAPSSGWVWPLSSNNGVGAYGSGHYARDFRGGYGTNVRAVADGTVTWSGKISSACGYGLIMKVDGTNLYATYEHLKSYKSKGSRVSKGATIAQIGSVPSPSGGCWYGYHLHLGVQTQGSYVESHRSTSSGHPDPCTWISGC